MTDHVEEATTLPSRELWDFVNEVRRVRRLVAQADEAVTGIFGYPEDHPERKRRIERAQRLMAEAVENGS